MSESPRPKTPPRISYEYIKSSQFRVIHCSGAVGGPTPQGFLAMTVFSERTPIPKSVVHEILQTGEHQTLGPEVVAERKSKRGIIREAEMTVLLSLDNATALRDWLNKSIETMQEIQQSTSQAPERSSGPGKR
jgi:hypothetical protein